MTYNGPAGQRKRRSRRYLQKEAAGCQVFIGGRATDGLGRVGGTLSSEGRVPPLGGRQTREVSRHVLDYNEKTPQRLYQMDTVSIVPQNAHRLLKR